MSRAMTFYWERGRGTRRFANYRFDEALGDFVREPPADHPGDLFRVRGTFRGEEYGIEAVVTDLERATADDPMAPEVEIRANLVRVFAAGMALQGCLEVTDGGPWRG